MELHGVGPLRAAAGRFPGRPLRACGLGAGCLASAPAAPPPPAQSGSPGRQVPLRRPGPRPAHHTRTHTPAEASETRHLAPGQTATSSSREPCAPLTVALTSGAAPPNLDCRAPRSPARTKSGGCLARGTSRGGEVMKQKHLLPSVSVPRNTVTSTEREKIKNKTVKSKRCVPVLIAAVRACDVVAGPSDVVLGHPLPPTPPPAPPRLQRDARAPGPRALAEAAAHALHSSCAVLPFPSAQSRCKACLSPECWHMFALRRASRVRSEVRLFPRPLSRAQPNPTQPAQAATSAAGFVYQMAIARGSVSGGLGRFRRSRNARRSPLICFSIRRRRRRRGGDAHGRRSVFANGKQTPPPPQVARPARIRGMRRQGHWAAEDYLLHCITFRGVSFVYESHLWLRRAMLSCACVKSYIGQRRTLDCYPVNMLQSLSPTLITHGVATRSVLVAGDDFRALIRLTHSAPIARHQAVVFPREVTPEKLNLIFHWYDCVREVTPFFSADGISSYHGQRQRRSGGVGGDDGWRWGRGRSSYFVSGGGPEPPRARLMQSLCDHPRAARSVLHMLPLHLREVELFSSEIVMLAKSLVRTTYIYVRRRSSKITRWTADEYYKVRCLSFHNYARNRDFDCQVLIGLVSAPRAQQAINSCSELIFRYNSAQCPSVSIDQHLFHSRCCLFDGTLYMRIIELMQKFMRTFTGKCIYAPELSVNQTESRHPAGVVIAPPPAIKCALHLRTVTLRLTRAESPDVLGGERRL
ncbi:Protein of unknown function [Gryllus bimaculatus]|nr:Protein of unknown function [Gryllus bimaculatus]